MEFEAALDSEDDRKRGLRLPDCSIYPLQAFFYREVAKYRDQVRRYVDVFGRENVQIIIFDEFASNTDRVYQETCEFLDVSPHFVPKFSIVNANKTVRSKTLRYFLREPRFPLAETCASP